MLPGAERGVSGSSAAATHMNKSRSALIPANPYVTCPLGVVIVPA